MSTGKEKRKREEAKSSEGLGPSFTAVMTSKVLGILVKGTGLIGKASTIKGEKVNKRGETRNPQDLESLEKKNFLSCNCCHALHG